MKRELRDKWAVTLESGNFTKGIGYLRNADNSCCCLGVLCDIVDPSGWDKPTTFGVHPYNGSAKMPPNEFLDKVGLTLGTATVLASANDGGASFKAIAMRLRALNVED